MSTVALQTMSFQSNIIQLKAPYQGLDYNSAIFGSNQAIVEAIMSGLTVALIMIHNQLQKVKVISFTLTSVEYKLACLVRFLFIAVHLRKTDLNFE